MNASSFAARLVAWQKNAGRHGLPWQNTRDAYRIWLSEVMLQQTQVSAVKPYYLRFLQRFPDVFALAQADSDDVMAAWAGLGYYSRARSLHRCAQQLVAERAGQFPDQLSELDSLPGIGRSTAAAIAVFAFGRREAILDGNVKRVLCRVFGIDRPMQSQATERELVALATELLPSDDIESYTQGLMDFGATLCTPRRPACTSCPFEADCVARSSEAIDRLPRPKVRRSVPLRRAAFFLLCHDARVLMQRRPASGIWGGLWCLPQSEYQSVAATRDQAAAIATSMLGCALESNCMPDAVARFTHGFTHFTLEATVWRFDLQQTPELPECRWVDASELNALALPQPIRHLFDQFADLRLNSSDLAA
jgi:A/G-specific adenine glycosylase